MYFIRARARIMIFPYIYIFFFSTKLAAEKITQNHAAVTSNRFWFGTKWGLGFYRHSCNKIERIITRDTRVRISVRENETPHLNCRAGVGSVRLFFESSAKTCSRSSRSRASFTSIFFSQYWFTTGNSVKRPRVADLRLVECSNSLFHPRRGIFDLSRGACFDDIHRCCSRA